MSVFVKITTPGGAVYRVSDGPTEHSGFAWRPILTNTVPIERAARATENGIPTTAQTLNIWNAERYIGVVDALLNDALTDSTVEIEVSEIQGGWNGIIKAWEQGSTGLLSIRAGQDALAVFKRQVPDETIRLVTFTGASREAIDTTIPTVIGGTTSDPVPVPGILIDRVGFTWAFCVGKCRSIVRVMRDRKVITTGFTTYLGAADQAIWPGMVCVKFAADPRDSNGAWPEITAELVGLEIGSTEAEGRNPARVIRAHLTTADTGACGWGLGEPADSIDTASFDQAVLDCDTLGLHLDGMMSQAALSSYWLSQMCLGGRLRLDKPAGKWRLRVDMATDSVKEYDADNILSYSFWPGDSSLRHKKARVEYRADFITKQFLGSATRTIGTIGEEENLLEQHLVRDHTTGNAIADYVANIEKYGELRMQIQTPDVAVGARTLEEDEVVTIRVREFPGGRLFRVTALSQGTDESRVELRSYADAIFDLATPSTTADPALDPIVRASPPPAAPIMPAGIELLSGLTTQDDGTCIVYVIGTYTPVANAVLVRVEVGDGASPSSWVDIGAVSNAGSFRHEPCKPGHLYTYRLTAINTGGSSESATASIKTEGDIVAPGVPSVVAVSKFTFATIKISLANPPADLAGFRVYRGTTENIADAEYLASVSSRDGVAEYSDHLPNYSQDYRYFARSYDCWRNIGDASTASAPVRGARILAADILRKLTPADALNTDPYFEDTSAWGGDLAGAVADPEHFATVADGIAGGTEFKTAAGERVVFGVSLDGLVPYDSTRKYVLAAFVRATGGGTHGLGFAFYDGAKTHLGTSSAQDSAISATSTWTEFSKTFAEAPSGTRYIGPAIICNGGSTAGVVVEVQKARLREVLTADILIANEAIITSAIQIAEGIIGNAHVANLDAEKITSGILDTARLSAAVAAVSQLTALGKNLIEDPSFLDFQDSFAMSGTATEAAVGRWTIAGDAAIPTANVSVLTADSKPTLVMTGKGIKLRPFAAATGNRLWMAQNVAVKPNESYCFSAHVTRDDAVPTDVTPPYDLIIEWRSSAGYLSQVAATNDALGRFYVSGTAPETASYAILYVMLPAHTPVSGYGTNMVVSAVQFERASVATFWVGREQGTITADRIFTGILRSMNYGTSAGSEIDLDSGTFKFGGSTAPKLSWDGTKMEMIGKAVIDEGSIGGFEVGEDSLTAGTSATAIGMSTDTDKAAFWAGGETAADAPFRIDHAGTGRVGVFEFSDTQFQSSLEDDLGVYPVITITPEGSYSSPQIELTNKDNFDQYGTFIYYGLKFGEFLFSIIRLMAQATGADAANAQVILNGMSSTEYSLAATGIVQGYISNLSDKKLKKDFSKVSTLEKLKQLDVSEWSYDEDAIESRSIERQRIEILQREGKVVTIPRRTFRKDEGHRHIGPTAEEFNTLFGVAGGNTESIGVGDQIGVVMRAVQELSDIVEAQAAEIAELRERLGIPRKMDVESCEEVRVRVTDEEAELIRHAENMSDDARKHVAKHTEDVMAEIRRWKGGRKK